VSRWLPVPLVSLAALAIGACGNSQPGYCDDRQDLKDAVDQLSDVRVRDSGLGALRAQLKTVQADAKTAVAAAKSDFPDETAAIGSAVDALSSVVQSVPSTPSAGECRQDRRASRSHRSGRQGVRRRLVCAMLMCGTAS
jgi:hypothetical protein